MVSIIISEPRKNLLPTESLDIILIPTTLHIFHHQTGLSDLGISDHPHLDHHTVLGCLRRLLLADVVCRLGQVVGHFGAGTGCR